MAIAANVRPGNIFKHENTLWEVVHFHHVQRPRLAPLVRLKMRNFKLGTIVERTFSPDDKFEDARVDERKLQYMYKQGEAYHFMDTENYEQYEFNEKQVGEQSHFLKEEMLVTMLIYEGEVLGVNIPNKVDLKITSAPPASKGDTVGNATKLATLETGAEVQVPMFIKEGDTIRVDTRTGEYVERV
ncbi:MAG: elongation factor P [Candidatus Goldiibacteriota bacterium]|jgi:elongation factor P